MATTDIYYALTVIANGAGTPAFYSLTPDPGLSIAQGGVTIVPTGNGSTMVNIYPQTLQISAPAGSVNGAVNIVTGASQISGRLMVSPPVNVAVVVTLCHPRSGDGQPRVFLAGGFESGAVAARRGEADRVAGAESQVVTARASATRLRRPSSRAPR